MSELDVLRTASAIAASISFIGSAIIIFSYLKFGGNIRLLICLSVADIVSDVVSLVSLAIESGETTACKAVAFLITWVDLVPIFWSASISASLFITIFMSYKFGKKGDAYFRYYFVFSWGVPLIIGIIGLAKDEYGDAESVHCWVKDDGLRLLYFYLPLWIVVLVNTVVYALIIREYKKVVVQHHGPVNSSSSLHRLHLYPAVLVFAWLPGTINRILQATGDPPFAFSVLHVLFGRSLGLFNAIVYGTDPMQALHPRLASWMKCKRHVAEPSTEPTEMTAQQASLEREFSDDGPVAIPETTDATCSYSPPTASAEKPPTDNSFIEVSLSPAATGD
eukprot:TRINITY_DN33657_c0_g1_i1.p1 TRINITY_DN33657_c0_g1~~TRINITY_DN33657_c0_g1_i1.p1  ORF type:complete len:359 (+),score=65.65 TRINITY_DN33657_c0_g1_i1:73-1077(+)